jgi:hypothetical protein
MSSGVFFIAALPPAVDGAAAEETQEVTVPLMSVGVVGSDMGPIVGLVETADVPLAFGAAEEPAPPTPAPAFAADGETVDLLTLLPIGVPLEV